MSEETKMILDAIQGINARLDKMEKEQELANFKLDHLKNKVEALDISTQMSILQNKKDHQAIEQNLDTVIELLREHDLLHMNYSKKWNDLKYSRSFLLVSRKDDRKTV